LAPLPSDPFARGKCGYRLLQYYAAGLPAVASPVGVQRTLAEGGALLARTPAEWTAALLRLRAEGGVRGPKGRAFVERRYAAPALAERLKRILA
jgi:glycosyltransferase involved in cell wall biosynthesis